MTLLTPNTLRKVTYQAVQLAFDADITLFTCYQNFLPSFSTYINYLDFDGNHTVLFQK